MKKTLHIYFLLFITGMVYSQQELPEMVIPSPQAFEITKFGNVPVDESSGRVSPSIPIYTYKVGALEVPISLHYSGNGVKVEQKPTWTGINWILNAGGVITRVVKDLPDETNMPRMFYSGSELESMRTEPLYVDVAMNPSNTVSPDIRTVFAGYIIPLSILEPIAEHPDMADSEVDEFNFSFPGYSGSFYLKKNANGVFEGKLLKYENELKIEVIGNFTLTGTYYFKITTPDGTSYYFGTQEEGNPGVYAIEESQLVDRTSGLPRSGKRCKTAFYLTKIENDLGDTVYFDYHTKNEHEVFSATSLEIKGVIDYDGMCQLNLTALNADAFNQNFIKNVIYNAKFLKRIWASGNTQKIDFNSFEVDNYLHWESLGLKFRVLSDIDFGLGRVDFDYLPKKADLLTDRSSREKFFLEKVTFKNASNTSKNEEYTLSYNDPMGLPKNTLSNAQDALGYFNGKTGNVTLLPKNSMLYANYYYEKYDSITDASPLPIGLANGNFTNYDSYLGDRSSSFAHATKGILQKITYPTGGSTVFEYEPVEKDKYTYGFKGLFAYINRSTPYPPRNPEHKPTDYLGMGAVPFLADGEEIPVEHAELSYIAQQININLNVTTYSRFGYNYRDCIYVQKRDAQNNVLQEKTWFFPNTSNDQNPQLEFTASLPFNLGKEEKCYFYMGFRSNVGGVLMTSGAPVEVQATFKFINGLDDNDGTGIRIKRVKDYENNNATPTHIKRYYYKNLTAIFKNSNEKKITLFRPFFNNFIEARFTCPNNDMAGSPITISNYYYITLNTNSFTLNLPSSDVMAMYPDVTISLGGDNFEQGAIEKKFLITSDPYQKYFPTIEGFNIFMRIIKTFTYPQRTNLGVFNGQLLEENVWRKGNSLEKIKKSTYNYQQYISDVSHNINGQKLKTSIDQATTTTYYLGLYDTNSIKINHTSSITKEFIDPVPLTKYTTPPFQYYPGWGLDDQDGDGVPNFQDNDLITPEEFADMSNDQIEEPFKKITTTQDISYSQLSGQPSYVHTTNSKGEVNKTKNYYPITSDINSLSSSLSSSQISTLNSLQTKHKIAEPFQIEQWKDTEKLSTLRNNYSIIENPNSFSIRKTSIQSSKGAYQLEDKIIYSQYDTKGNPVEITYADRTKITYIWSLQRKIIYKIINASYNDVISAMTSHSIFNPIEDNGTTPNPGLLTNPFIAALPNSQATIYNYDPITQLLKSTVAPHGEIQFYEYDEFNRLKYIKDHQGNIVKENNYNYRPN